MGDLFYNLGRAAGPKIRRGKWLWQSITATKNEALEAEYDVGKDLAYQLRRQVQLDSDPEHTAVLEKIALKLQSRLTNKLRKFQFEIISVDQPNAFALPGGFIFVSLPLLELCHWNNDQIAFVMAHEMGHVIRGHAVERFFVDSAIAGLLRASPIRADVIAGWVGRVGLKFFESAYSQDREYQADTFGARLTIACGCDSKAPAALLSSLSKAASEPSAAGLGAYFASHPPFAERIKNLQALHG